MYAYPMSRPPRTTDGLKWVVMSFYLYFGLLIVELIFAIVALNILSSFDPTTPPNQILQARAVLVVGAILILVLGILVLVFYLLGFGYMYGGRNEFGPDHARDMGYALWMLIGAIVVTVVGFVVQIILVFGQLFSLQPPDPGSIFVSLAVSIGFGIFTAALVAGVLVLSVRTLADAGHRTLIYAAAGLGTATPGIVGALALVQLPGLVGGGLGDPTIGIPTAVGVGLGLLTFALFLLVYRRARQRIQAGELQPTLPPPMPYAMWPPAMAPPPPPPPMAPPAAPPPAQPPTEPQMPP